MNLLSPKTIKELLLQHNASPSKRLGQNFLVNPGVLKKIIEAANLGKRDIVLETGPGLGTLTQELAKRAKKVVAIEKDRKMVEILKETMAEYENVEIIEGDVLKFLIDSLFVIPAKAGIQINGSGSRVKPGMTEARYKLVANLPYYITSPVIRKFLETEIPPSEMILMVQKEVAQRICAKPPEMSLLAVSVQFYAHPKIICYVSKGSFWPAPKVDSAILRIKPHKLPVVARRSASDDEAIPWKTTVDDYRTGLPRRSPLRGSLLAMTQFRDAFFRVLRAGFSSPRKQLINNLSKRLELDRAVIEAAMQNAKIKPEQRAETLSVDDWTKLAELLKQSS